MVDLTLFASLNVQTISLLEANIIVNLFLGTDKNYIAKVHDCSCDNTSTLFILPEKWHHTKLRGMHIADDITTDDTTVVLYHDGSTTSTLTFVFLLLARQSPNQFSLCSSFVRRFFVSVVT